ncbi:hypothetical protein GCM10027033_21990 [Leucobacter ruminantium]
MTASPPLLAVTAPSPTGASSGVQQALTRRSPLAEGAKRGAATLIRSQRATAMDAPALTELTRSAVIER